MAKAGEKEWVPGRACRKKHLFTHIYRNGAEPDLFCMVRAVESGGSSFGLDCLHSEARPCPVLAGTVRPDIHKLTAEYVHNRGGDLKKKIVPE